MGDDEDPEIAAALTNLAGQDAAAADDARAALEWIAGERGLAFITQERIQNFCWYELPVKWLVDLDEKIMITAALAQALDLLQLPRYAAICRSQTTREVLAAYETSTAHGKAAFRRAAANSGIMPPDLPDFEWGAVMGWQEASARSSTADFLEVAVTSGDLVPGRRGWKARQQELVRAHLDTPQPDLLGQTLALLLDADEMPGRQITDAVGLAVAEEGFRNSRTGEPPDDHDVSWAVHTTSNLCRALGLLAVGSDWRDRGYGLTDTGQATALEALRARATGPRTIPWP